MTREEVLAELSKKRRTPTRYLMGTTAIHLMGDISSSTPDLFHTSWETDDYYVGAWVTGFGFIEVLFPKSTSRELTEKEIKYYHGRRLQIGSSPAGTLNVK